VTVFDDITPDFTFYEDVYHGRGLDAETFASVLMDSVAEVESRLMYGAVLDEDIAKRCKMAVCAIAEAAGNPDSRLRSYTAGKTSQTFSAPPFSMRAEAAVRRYLSNTGVLKGGRWL
jgi:hypothetical protein